MIPDTETNYKEFQKDEDRIKELQDEIKKKKAEIRKLKAHKKHFCEYVTVPELDYYDIYTYLTEEEMGSVCTEEEHEKLLKPHLNYEKPAEGRAYNDMCKLARKLFKGKYDFKNKSESLRTIPYVDQRIAASFINSITKEWNKCMLKIYGEDAVLDRSHAELVSAYWQQHFNKQDDIENEVKELLIDPLEVEDVY